MQFYGSILALCLLQGTSSFTVQPSQAFKTSLQSSQYDPNAGPIAKSPDKSIAPRGGDMQTKDIWETSTPITVQGGSLRTCSLTDPFIERVQLMLKTDGRPLSANIDLWHGPDNTPQKLGVYIEDGNLRPFSAIIQTPRGHNALAIYNTGHLEFPMAAAVVSDVEAGSSDLKAVVEDLLMEGNARIVQGGAVKTYPFPPTVQSVQILMKTDGRPLNARIELLQGPNNIKQAIEIYTEDGALRPFFAVLETPGTGNVVRIVNTATVEFPLTAVVEAYQVMAGPDGSLGHSWSAGPQGSEGNWDSGPSLALEQAQWS